MGTETPKAKLNIEDTSVLIVTHAPNMKKHLLVSLCLVVAAVGLLYYGSSFGDDTSIMPMVEETQPVTMAGDPIVLTLTFEPAQAARASAAINGLWPIPQIPDPDFVGDPEDAPLVDEWTDMEWAKIKLRKWLSRTVHRWEDKVAKKAVEVAEDPDIAS